MDINGKSMTKTLSSSNEDGITLTKGPSNFTEVEVACIAHYLTKQHFPNKYRLAIPPFKKEGSTLAACLKPILLSYNQKPELTIIPLNILDQHWVIIFLIPQNEKNIVLYKDSLGEHRFAKERTEVRSVFEEKLDNVEFKYSSGNEQEDYPSSCVFALYNMLLMADNLDTNMRDYIKEFQSSQDFTNKTVAEKTQKEVLCSIHMKCKDFLQIIHHRAREHHHRECEAIRIQLEDMEHKIRVLREDHFFDSVAETNTICIEVSIPKQIWNDYSYSYHITPTDDLLTEDKKILKTITRKLGVDWEDIDPSYPTSVMVPSSKLSIEKGKHLRVDKIVDELVATPASDLIVPSIQDSSNTKKWRNLSLQTKAEKLQELNPVTRRQFTEISGESQPQEELADILRYAIEEGNYNLAKIITRIGLEINKRCWKDGMQVSFLTMARYELHKNSQSVPIKKIERLLMKYGCTEESIGMTVEKYKAAEYEKILAQIAVEHEVSLEVFREFQDLLKSTMFATIRGIISAANGRASIKQSNVAPNGLDTAQAALGIFDVEDIGEEGKEQEDPDPTFDDGNDYLDTEYDQDRTDDEEFMVEFVNVSGKAIPIATTVADIAQWVVKKRKFTVFKDIVKHFVSAASVDSIVNDYSVGVIKYSPEEILSPVHLGFSGKGKELKEKALKKLFVHQAESYEFGDTDYTEAWTVLVRKYTAIFIKFLISGEARHVRSNLGLFVVRRIFEENFVKERDFENIDESINSNTVKAFARLLMYVENHSFTMRVFTEWSFIKNVYYMNFKGVKAQILISPEKIILCFDAPKKVKLSEFYNEVCFENKNKDRKMFPQIMEEFEKFKEAHYFFVGNENSRKIIKKICEDKLLGVLHVESKNVQIYLFGTTKSFQLSTSIQNISERLSVRAYLHTALNTPDRILPNGLSLVTQAQIELDNIAKDATLANKRMPGLTGDLHEVLFKMIEKNIPPEAKDALAKVAKSLVDRGAGVNTDGYIGSMGHTPPLHIASRSGHLGIVKYLLSKGANINAKNRIALKNAHTPLYYAAESGNLDLVRYFVEERKLDITDRSFNGYTPLHGAVGSMQVMKYFVGLGIGVNTNEVLHKAVEIGSIEQINYLMDRGLKINDNLNNQNNTALDIAISLFNYKFIKYLIERGANYEHVNQEKITCFDKLMGTKLAPVTAFRPVFEKMREVKTDLSNWKSIQYLLILKLQRHELVLSDYTLALEDITSEYTANLAHIYFIAIGFVSECYKMEFAAKEALIDKKKFDDPKIRQENEHLIKYINKFFEGIETAVQYNKALKLMLSPEATRFDQIIAISEQFSDNAAFMFLKALANVYKANSIFVPTRTKESYIEEANNLGNVLSEMGCVREQSFIQGELCMIHQDVEGVKRIFQEEVDNGLDFHHPIVRLMWALARQGEFKAVNDYNEEKLSREILSIDVELAQQDVIDYLETQEFINVQTQRLLAEQGFDRALGHAFAMDVHKVKPEMLKLMPKSLAKKYVEIIKSLDYAYNLLKSFWSKFLTKKDQGPLISPNDDFFAEINQMIKDLSALRSIVTANKFSLQEDFDGNQQRQTRFYRLLDGLIYYYSLYIDTVLRNFKQAKEPDYIRKFNNGLGRHLDLNFNMEVLTEDGEKLLVRSNTINEYINMKGPESYHLYGTHKIAVYPMEGDNRVYYKYMPYAPGVEFAVASIYNEIIPNTTPETRLIRLKENGKSVIYLASKSVVGRNFADVINQPEIVAAIDMKNFSGLFLCSLLVCPGDAKPDNFILQFRYDQRGIKSTGLVSVDNDIAFCRQTLQINTQGKKIYSDMLNILYLMPQMNNCISTEIRESLFSQQPESIIIRWLSKLDQKNKNYIKAGFTLKELEKALLPIKLPTGTASKIYTQLCKIYRMMRSNIVTHNDIFQSLCPSISEFYIRSRDSVSMVTSLKNLYLAAGSHPSLIQMLHSPNKIASSKAWTTLSASKRRDPKEFGRIFDQTIQEAAEEFISHVDFSKQNDNVIAELEQHFDFLENVVLHNISLEQLKRVCGNMKLNSIKLINPLEKVASAKWITEVKKIKVEVGLNEEKVKIEVPPLEINQISDLITRRNMLPEQSLTREGLMKFLLENRLMTINKQDSLGNTALHDAAMRGDLKIINLLLDCGADSNIKNKSGRTAADVCISSDIAIMITEHKPTFFWSLCREGRINEAKIIAHSMSQNLLKIHNEDSELTQNVREPLEECLEDPGLKELAFVLIKKIERISNPEFIRLCVENYPDTDVHILDAIIENNAELVDMCNKDGALAAHTAYDLKKFNMLVCLVNAGSNLKTNDENIKTILQAAKWGMRIEERDFTSKFDYGRQNDQGDTIFHLMCRYKNLEIFRRYKNTVMNYKDLRNSKGNTVVDMAEKWKFVEGLELFYAGQDLYVIEPDDVDTRKYHKLTRLNPDLKELSKVLKHYGKEMTIKEAIEGVNLKDKIDAKGNTLVHKVIKDYMKLPNDEKLENDLTCLVDKYKAGINDTERKDRNTALHLAARSGNQNVVRILLKHYEVKELVENANKETALELAERYGHVQVVDAIRSWVQANLNKKRD